jgi:hypothetical protein
LVQDRPHSRRPHHRLGHSHWLSHHLAAQGTTMLHNYAQRQALAANTQRAIMASTPFGSSW